MVDKADFILEAARHRQMSSIWFLSLFLVMPDHIHMLVHIPEGSNLSKVIGGFKRYLSTYYDIKFQRGYFDTRIRDAEHYDEKWKYIVKNPVAKGLVEKPREWPHSIAFDRITGAERPHR